MMVQVKGLHQVLALQRKVIKLLQELLTKEQQGKQMIRLLHQGQVSSIQEANLLMKDLQAKLLRAEMQEHRKDTAIKMYTNTDLQALREQKPAHITNPGNILLLNQGRLGPVKNILHPDFPTQEVYRTDQASIISGIYLKAGIQNPAVPIRKDMLHQKVIQEGTIRNHPDRIRDILHPRDQAVVTLHPRDLQAGVVIRLQDPVAAEVILLLQDRAVAEAILLLQNPAHQVQEQAGVLPAAKEEEDNS